MKTQKWLIWIVLMSLVALLAFAVPAAAQASITEIAGTESCFPTAFGTWTFPDGNIHVREMVLQCHEQSADPRGAGNNTVVMNANWDSNSLGPMWGTFHFETDEGGVWEGTWEGMMTTSGGKYHAMGTGQGIYEGMKMWLNAVGGVWQARILDPHSD